MTSISPELKHLLSDKPDSTVHSAEVGRLLDGRCARDQDPRHDVPEAWRLSKFPQDTKGSLKNIFCWCSKVGWRAWRFGGLSEFRVPILACKFFEEWVVKTSSLVGKI